MRFGKYICVFLCTFLTQKFQILSAHLIKNIDGIKLNTVVTIELCSGLSERASIYSMDMWMTSNLLSAFVSFLISGIGLLFMHNHGLFWERSCRGNFKI